MQSLLTLRKLTRSLGELVRSQLHDYLTTLTPLMVPEAVLGEHVQGGRRWPNSRPDHALKALQSQYEAVAPAMPLNLRRELTTPFDLSATGLEITPVEYVHVIASGEQTRHITVRRPLLWTLTYAGFAPGRLQEQLQAKSRSPQELQRFIITYLLLQLLPTYQPGVAQILTALNFPLTHTTVPEFGNLPVTRIGIPIETSRPSDTVVLDSAELTGIDAFEEVVNLDDVARLPTPFKQRLLDAIHAGAGAP
jgi:hypothetical protein